MVDEGPGRDESRRRGKSTLIGIAAVLGFLVAGFVSKALFGDDRLVGSLLVLAVGTVCLGNVWLNVRDYGHAEVLGRSVGKDRNRAGYWGFVGLNVLVGVGLLVMAVYLVFREQTPGQ